MISQPLRLRHGKAPLRPAAAWLVPGADPQGWLEELLRWGVPHTSLMLRIVPHALDDLRPRGVLVTAGAEPKVSRRCLAYGRLAERLFLPVEAYLNPDISEAELTALLGPGEYVLHPSAGLIGFEAGDLLRLADLLRGTRATGRSWDRASPGVTFARRLTFLAPEEVPTTEAILRQGRGDIGSSAGQLDELPPLPGEEPVKEQGEAGGGLARFVKWLMGKGSSATRRANLEERRKRELARLLRLLDKEPDQGLRFALPIAGKPHRGLAPPSDKLGRRDTNFDLQRLGGGPADFWDIHPEQRNQLVARYRQLADREVALGRHRRAAYIYAELLGDVVAAATALSAGGHWREAATLYREKLLRPWEAARCLERGGLWAEAVVLYEELQAFEKAGDLYARLEQAEDAAAQYRKAVTRHRAGGDFVAAARLLDDKLKLPSEAARELAAGWPSSAQAAECLRGMFRLLGRLGEHDKARAWVEYLLREPVPPGREVRLAEALADTATAYPDRAIQAVAADGTRILTARLLPAASRADTRQLLDVIARLEPQDRLLGRDCQRYLQQRPLAARPMAARPSRRGTLTLVGRIELPAGIEWDSALASGDTIYAAGGRGTEIVIVRCSVTGTIQELPGPPWHAESLPAHVPIMLAAQPTGDDRLIVHVFASTVPRQPRTFPATDAFQRTVTVGSAAGLERFTLALERTPTGTTWLLDKRNEMLTLIGLGADDKPLTTRVLAPMSEWHRADLSQSFCPWPLLVRNEIAYVGFGDRLLIVTARARQPEVVEIGRAVTRLCGSAPNAPLRLAVSCARGGLLYRGDSSGRGPLEPFATDLVCPVTAFTAAGDLVAADGEGCEVYGTHEGSLKLKAALSGFREQPLAVLPLPKPDQFALFLENGELAVYQVPAS